MANLRGLLGIRRMNKVPNARIRLIDTEKECLKKRGLDVRQAMRMVHDRSVWGGM